MAISILGDSDGAL